jgi:UDP-2,4-diacetamido-2,4,6-trideoxy-beta-L-altropyranose hydrolase
MNLLIRADSSTVIGQGHLTRCLALAHAWRAAGGHAEFLSYCEGDSLKRRIASDGFAFSELGGPHPNAADLDQTCMRATQMANSITGKTTWVVLDGYHFDDQYLRAVRQRGVRLLVVEDLVRFDRYHADVILNQNIFAERLPYASEMPATLLLGCQYALLRPEFLPWIGWHRHIHRTGRRILISMGGGDPYNLTGNIIRAVLNLGISGIEAKVVVGPNNRHSDDLEKIVGDTKKPRHATIELLHDVSCMPELMAWADLAVSAAGSTSWELCFMGLPSILIFFAENQRGIAMGLHEAGAGLNLGFWQHVSDNAVTETLAQVLNDPGLRGRMSESGRRIVDGKGAERVAQVLKK